MIETSLTRMEGSWAEEIKERQATLEQIQSELVELESVLADLLAAINAFEFKLRSRLRPLISRLESLEAEVNEYRRQLRRERPEEVRDEWAEWSGEDESAASAGDYRYWGKSTPPPSPQLLAVDSQELKRLFRKLARRFHPDMALDDEDRAYRTGIMMAINAAYANGDLEKLRELELEPDGSQRVNYAQTDEQLAEALLREIGRCRRRIDEIRTELATAEAHENSRLMRRVQEAAAVGSDLLANIVHQLREEISQRMVERDVLKAEVESASESSAEPGAESLAYMVWDTIVEETYDDNLETQFAERLRQRQSRFLSEEDTLNDFE